MLSTSSFSRIAWFSAYYYAVAHVPGIIIFLVWLYARHRDVYPHWRNALEYIDHEKYSQIKTDARRLEIIDRQYAGQTGFIDDGG